MRSDRDHFERLLESGALSAAAGILAGSRLAAGELVDHYEILEEIGRGGMGVVYRAFDRNLQRDVALKMLLSGDRLWKEARAVASLKHPNIGVVHEIGEWNGEPYLAMELLEGETLADRLVLGGIGRTEAQRIAMDIIAGLSHAHSRGVLHRDLKPANVVLTQHGAQIIDFGLAGDDAETDLPLGTPRYASPEQSRGEETDSRSDIYSLGVVLSELLDDAHASLVERCRATDPEDRFASIDDVAEALRESNRWRSAWRIALVVGVVVAGAIAFLTADRTRQPLELALENPIQVTSDVGVEEHARWSSDGRTVAYHSNATGSWDIWVKKEESRPENRTMTPERSERFPSWSPDGEHIAYWADGHVYVMAAFAGSARRVARADTASAPAWSADGERLMFVDGKEAKLTTLAGESIENIPLPGRNTRRFDLDWSLDERFLAYVDANA